MKLGSRFLAGLLLLQTVSAQTTTLADDEVNEAITLAKQPRFESLYVEARGPFAADFSVLLQGPVGRAMDVAREAHESYKPITAANIPDAVKARHVTALVVMHSDGQRPHVKNVVVMPVGAVSRDAVIQPLPNVPRAFELGVAMPRTWKAGYGWRPTGLPAAYRFAQSDLPAGDLHLVVATDRGDRRYTVRAADRARMR
jgi:hypothetical protein